MPLIFSVIWRKIKYSIRLNFAVFLAFFTLFHFSAHAEQLAIKNFAIPEGLARNQTTTIFADSRGFVWIGTADGLSRFDGYGFTNYKTQNGLPHPIISGIIEDKEGIYWVSTHAGLCRIDFTIPLDSEGKLNIELIKFGDSTKQIVYSIFQDSRKNLWAGTRDGLFRITESDGVFSAEKVNFSLTGNSRREGISGLVEDRNQNIWITNPEGLFRIDKKGKITTYSISEYMDQYFDRLGNIAIDEKGLLWIGGLNGLYVVNPPVDEKKIIKINKLGKEINLPANAGEFIILDEKDGLIDKRALSIFRSRENKIWIATRTGFSIFDGSKFNNFSTKNGLISDEILSFAEDATGNIWVGTESTGVMRIAQNGFTTYNATDGLPSNRISSIFQGTDDEIYIVFGNRQISRFDNGSFTSVKPNFPKHITEFGWSWQNPVLQDSQGEWWFATAQGLVRFPKVKNFQELEKVVASAIYDAKNGLAGNQVYRLFEDSEGNIWISNFSPPTPGLARWHRQTNTIQQFNQDFTGKRKNLSAYSFAEDRQKNIWFGLNTGGIAKFQDGKLHLIEDIPNMPTTNIYDMLLNKDGNLWLATGAGAFLAQNLSAEKPSFTTLTTADGLSTNDIIAVTDDQEGQIYFATSQGIHRYHPETKRIELFTTADGIANSELRTAMRSKDGSLWFGTIRGLTRFKPGQLKEIDQPAPILISSVQIGGKPFPMSELGKTDISGIEISPNQNHIEIEVLGLSLNSGDILKYQYKLDENDPWSEPTSQRKFTLVNLQPGDYEFQARVINSNGMISENTATVTFTALAPFYLRWWFWILLGLLVCGLAYLFYRSRIKRLIELEKVRHSIATDLHDDIGSSLSQISLISEVLALKRNEHEDETESLETIAKTSREAVGSMSEMVWAINPKRDNLPDTINRMRRFTSETLTAANIRFTFQTPELDKNSKINVDTRRHIYLIYKEIINNIVKHSAATEVSVSLTKSANNLVLVVTDNGQGFVENEHQTGNGLANMRNRTEKIGATLKIDSIIGKGTSISLQIPNKSSLLNKLTT